MDHAQKKVEIRSGYDIFFSAFIRNFMVFSFQCSLLCLSIM